MKSIAALQVFRILHLHIVHLKGEKSSSLPRFIFQFLIKAKTQLPGSEVGSPTKKAKKVEKVDGFVDLGHLGLVLEPLIQGKTQRITTVLPLNSF